MTVHLHYASSQHHQHLRDHCSWGTAPFHSSTFGPLASEGRECIGIALARWNESSLKPYPKTLKARQRPTPQLLQLGACCGDCLWRAFKSLGYGFDDDSFQWAIEIPKYSWPSKVRGLRADAWNGTVPHGGVHAASCCCLGPTDGQLDNC